MQTVRLEGTWLEGETESSREAFVSRLFEEAKEDIKANPLQSWVSYFRTSLTRSEEGLLDRFRLEALHVLYLAVCTNRYQLCENLNVDGAKDALRRYKQYSNVTGSTHDVMHIAAQLALRKKRAPSFLIGHDAGKEDDEFKEIRSRIGAILSPIELSFLTNEAFCEEDATVLFPATMMQSLWRKIIRNQACFQDKRILRDIISHGYPHSDRYLSLAKKKGVWTYEHSIAVFRLRNMLYTYPTIHEQLISRNFNGSPMPTISHDKIDTWREEFTTASARYLDGKLDPKLESLLRRAWDAYKSEGRNPKIIFTLLEEAIDETRFLSGEWVWETN